eukprot:CAMPEP_0168562666 /NCGR_PEP_ID=MMETSP0413-20121227/12253_1 /TAXON_ID=136452 /ORGANISM="Filamoeba nolandi, Strain NC-AS-23-1" /LENGTH=1290 /DNA_ID=CAMNT_0008594125 /DNA_START=110 /DNA_END=3979 /DNA_ORIENTATION=+
MDITDQEIPDDESLHSEATDLTEATDASEDDTPSVATEGNENGEKKAKREHKSRRSKRDPNDPERKAKREKRRKEKADKKEKKSASRTSSSASLNSERSKKKSSSSSSSETTTNLLTWGSTEYGKLGIVTSDPVVSNPKALESLKTKHIISIACSANASAAVTSKGEVFIWGRGKVGNNYILGDKRDSDVKEPSLLNFKTSSPVILIRLGLTHGVLVTASGQVYTFGAGESGQLGHGDTTSQVTPKAVAALQDVRIVDAACGDKHTVFLGDSGQVFCCGSNDHGQLAVADNSTPTPSLVDMFQGKFIGRIAAGPNATACLTRDGELYVFGHGLPFGSAEDIKIPKLVPLSGKTLHKVIVGESMTAAITESGDLLTWGTGTFLGHSDTKIEKEPRLIEEIRKKSIRDVACAKYTACLTDNGQLIMFGQLGVLAGQTEKENSKATFVEAMVKNSRKIACGVNHSALVSDSARSNRDRYAWKIASFQRSVVRGLTAMLTHYYNPLFSKYQTSNPTTPGKKDKKEKIDKKTSLLNLVTIAEDDLKAIFRNVDELYGINSQLLQQLNDAMERWSSKTPLSDILVEFVNQATDAYLRFYKDFANYNVVMGKITSKSPLVLQWLKEAQQKADDEFRKIIEEDEARDFSLTGLLNEPEADLEKLHSLVTGLAKYTDFEPEKNNLQTVLSQIDDLKAKVTEISSKFGVVREDDSVDPSWDRTIVDIGEYGKSGRHFLKTTRKLLDARTSSAEDYKTLIEDVSNMKPFMPAQFNYGPGLDAVNTGLKQLSFLYTELVVRTTNNFEKPFTTYLEQLEKDEKTLTALKKKLDEALAAYIAAESKKAEKQDKDPNKAAEDLETKKKALEAAKAEFQIKFKQVEKERNEASLKAFHQCFSALYDFHANSYKRLDKMKSVMEDFSKQVGVFEREDWAKSQEQTICSAIVAAWQEDDPQKKELAAAPLVAQVRERVKSALSADQAKPEKKYIRLVDLLASPSLEVVNALAVNSGQKNVLEWAARVLDAHKKLFPIIELTITQEVANTTDPTTLFRANSTATKLMGTFTKMIGDQYVHALLQDLINDVLANPSGYEVDPKKVKDASQIPANVERLKATSQKFLQRILDNSAKAPTPFYAMAHKLKTEVAKKFPKHYHIAVGGFIFLRVFCPSIMTPWAFGLCEENAASEDSKRAFILISKLLQNLANGVHFGKKEEYMKELDPFIENNVNSVFAYYDKLADTKFDTNNLQQVATLEEVTTKELPKIHKFLLTNLDKIITSLVKYNNKDVIPQLSNVLVEMGNYSLDS